MRRPKRAQIVTLSVLLVLILGLLQSASAPPLLIPGPGLAAAVVGASVNDAGIVSVRFTLTDAAGIPLTPTASQVSPTSDPGLARVRFTIARLEVDRQTAGGNTVDFTRYLNYLLTASGEPTFDTGGSFLLEDPATGTYRYTFGGPLRAPFPASAALVHTVGGQVDRFFDGVRLAANPIFDFVPDASALTIQRETVATAACNSCHNPLAVHGGGRREVRLCVLCHTEQLVETDTGNRLDFKVMIHKIHTGKELPSVVAGPVGTRYAIGNAVFSEKVRVCVAGPKEGAPCTGDSNCGFGTCTGTATTGVGFPQDIRNCTKCHTGGATAHTFKTLPSTPACTGCHDNVNPSTAAIVTPPQSNLGTLLAGANHGGGAQPEAACAGCHTPGDGRGVGRRHSAKVANEATISVTGAHTIPQQSQQLPGLVAELLEASGTAGNGITIKFRLKNGDGTPITSLAAPVGQISVRASGPTTDFGGSSNPMLSQTVSDAIGPDAGNAFTFTTTGANRLPIDATGTWRVGLEARRTLTINLVGGPTSVTEFAQNPVRDFSVDGSPVVPRRTVVAIGNCQECHGTFSQGFNVHGGARNQTNHCVICHNPNVSDFGRRVNAFTSGANPALANEPINLKHLLHKVHTGEDLQNKPYMVYGFGSAPKNYTAFDFSEIRFPGDRRDCATCHVSNSQLLPLRSGLLPTRLSQIRPGAPPTETPTGSILPITDACLTCHDSTVAATHAQINTLGVIETCEVCHGEGSIAAVSAVHRR